MQDVLLVSNFVFSCKSSLKEYRTAHQKATFRRTVMRLERERAHEIAQLQLRRKHSTTVNRVEHGTELLLAI